MDSSFVKAAVQVPHLSGFDKSHQNLLTTKCGTITPIMIDELIPGSKVNLKLALSASLPPLASETFMRCSVKVEAFFVPFRLLAGSFESWFTDTEKKFAPYVSGSNTITPTARKGFLPCIGGFSQANDSAFLAKLIGPGTLSDYLGYRSNNPGLVVASGSAISAMPFLAYQRVYHDWYRNSLVQSDVFLPPAHSAPAASAPGASPAMAGCAPYLFFQGAYNGNTYGPYYIFNSEDSLLLADGKYLYELRQRNFGLDYFTTATPTEQQGTAETVSFSVANNSGSFSIAALRAANSMQQFKERNNLAGNLFVEQCRARYGVSPSDGVAQRSLYLGSADFEVYSKGIYENANSGTANAQNPTSGVVGARFGSAYAGGNGQLVSEFEAKEPGYLLVNATLVPRVTYSTGVHRRFTNYVGAGSLADLANPILQNVGPQEIASYELNGSLGPSFGFTDRYATFKTMEDELHGLVRDGQSLESFALQRSFSNTSLYQINSSFLEIPTNYMDQVTAAAATISTFGCWMDCYFDYKVAQPLAKYSLPSLQDPAYEHGRTIVVAKGGHKL